MPPLTPPAWVHDGAWVTGRRPWRRSLRSRSTVRATTSTTSARTTAAATILDEHDGLGVHQRDDPDRSGRSLQPWWRGLREHPDRGRLRRQREGTSGEQGAFMIHGNVITWLPAGGGSYANTVGFKPGGLYLDGKLWLHCM